VICMSLTKISPEQQRMVNKEIKWGHHIPTVLIKRASELKRIECADTICASCKSYAKRRFLNVLDEYRFIHRCEEELLRKYFDAPFSKPISAYLWADIATTIDPDEKIRRSFIHAFQTFLIGALITDHFYDEFCKDLPVKDNLEALWCLTALYHDLSKPVGIVLDTIEAETGPLDIYPKRSLYCKNLSSIYQSAKCGKPLQRWEFGGHRKFNQDLYSIFCKWQYKNHGIKSAFSLLKHTSEILGQVPSHIALSALAIALHDKDLHDDLIEKNIFPLNRHQFLLTCLLVLCDSIQEWGREIVSDRRDIRLVNFAIDNRTIGWEISFDENISAQQALEQYGRLERCIDFCDISLSYGIRGHICVRDLKKMIKGETT